MPLFVEEWPVMTFFVVVTALLSGVEASYGDNSYPFRKCLDVCLSHRCQQPSGITQFYNVQPLYLRLLGWDCVSECKHDCMWEAVGEFVKNKEPIPQFYGKWPFVRWLGMQEPASAIASVLNGVSQIYTLRRFHRVIPSTAPFFHLWRAFALVVINAWFWSFIFHVRDTEWTERFDYFFAFSLILMYLYSCLVRIVGSSPVRKPMALGLILGFVFLHHCVSMSVVKFDYGYNMKVNVCFAAMNIIAWTSYCGYMIYKGYSYFWWAILFNFWFTFAALLETIDIPPILWTFDSHALWHISTIPLPVIFFKFAFQDCLAQLRGQEISTKTAYHFEMEVDDWDNDEDRTKGE